MNSKRPFCISTVKLHSLTNAVIKFSYLRSLIFFRANQSIDRVGVKVPTKVQRRTLTRFAENLLFENQVINVSLPAILNQFWRGRVLQKIKKKRLPLVKVTQQQATSFKKPAPHFLAAFGRRLPHDLSTMELIISKIDITHSHHHENNTRKGKKFQ